MLRNGRVTKFVLCSCRSHSSLSFTLLAATGHRAISLWPLLRGPNPFLLETAAPSPHPSPQAPLGSPWQSGQLVADGAMWTNQEVGQENTAPSSIGQSRDCLDFNHSPSEEPARSPSSQKMNFLLSPFNSSSKNRPLPGRWLLGGGFFISQ